jgi:hypothetical protein
MNMEQTTNQLLLWCRNADVWKEETRAFHFDAPHHNDDHITRTSQLFLHSSFEVDKFSFSSIGSKRIHGCTVMLQRRPYHVDVRIALIYAGATPPAVSADADASESVRRRRWSYGHAGMHS